MFKRILVPLFVILILIASPAPVLHATEGDMERTSEKTIGEASSAGDTRQKSKSGDSPSGLEEVVVTATRLPTPTKQLPVPVQVISKEEIAESHSDNLGDLLVDKLPEHFQKYPGALASVSIRGFRTDTTGTDIKGRVLLLIDGHRAGTGNIAVIPLENVERIEIVRGPGSVVYGSAAMGGVINIITRKGKGAPSGNAGVEYGSWDHVKGSAGLSSGFWEDRIGVSLTGRSITQNSYERGGGKEVPNTDYNDQAYSMSLFAAPHPDHSFFAVGSFFQAWDVGTPGPDYDLPNTIDNKDILRGYGSLSYDGAFPEWDMNWHLSYYNVLDRNEWNSPAATYGYSSSTTDSKTQGIRSQLRIPTCSLGRLLIGFDWDGIEVESTTEPAGFSWGPDSRYDNYAFFAEEKIDWSRLTLLMGARYDLFDEAIERTQGLDVIPRSERFDHVSWRGGLTYAFLDWLTGRTAVGTGFRVPAADELSGSFESGSWMKVVGNPDLKPESSTTYEAGLTAEHSGIKGDLGFFYTDYKDKISGGFPTCVDGDCTWTTYRNVAGAVLSGIEGALSYKKLFSACGIPVRMKPFVNFVYYTQRENKDTEYAEVLGSDTVPYVPLWNVTGGLEVNFNRKITFIFNGFYSGAEKQQDFNWLSPTYGEAVDKGGFVVFSAQLSFQPSKYLELFATSDNLTDRDYAFVDGYPMPGRSFRVGLKTRF